MEILKIIFQHDITLGHLSGHQDKSARETREKTLEAFLRPEKTYNRYYFTGTIIADADPGAGIGSRTENSAYTDRSGSNFDDFRKFRFGLNTLSVWPLILSTLEQLLADEKRNSPHDEEPGWFHTDGSEIAALSKYLQKNPRTHSVFLFGKNPQGENREIARQIILDNHTGIRENFRPMTALLDSGYNVLLTEKAHHGIDIHLFSAQNLYETIFDSCKKLISPGLRYFSINANRVGSERHFYFETWTLDRPPHGFQEVTKDATIR